MNIRQTIERAFVILVILFAAFFSLVMAAYASDVYASDLETIIDTEAGWTGYCSVVAETTSNYQQFSVDAPAYIHEAEVWLRKFNSNTNSYSLSFLVNDQLEAFSFYSTDGLSSSTSSPVILDIPEVLITPDDKVQFFVTAVGNIAPQRVLIDLEDTTNFTQVCRDTLEQREFNSRLRGYFWRSSWLYPLLPHTFASSTCELVISGNTTTAECSDPIVTNQSQDIFNGLILFITIFVLTILGFEHILNRKKRFQG